MLLLKICKGLFVTTATKHFCVGHLFLWGVSIYSKAAGIHEAMIPINLYFYVLSTFIEILNVVAVISWIR